jgi:FixJ family two-component response regulator
MTGPGTIATAVDTMKAGDFVYLLKPFTLSILLPVIFGTLCAIAEDRERRTSARSA